MINKYYSQQHVISKGIGLVHHLLDGIVIHVDSQASHGILARMQHMAMWGASEMYN